MTQKTALQEIVDEDAATGMIEELESIPEPEKLPPGKQYELALTFTPEKAQFIIEELEELTDG